MLAVLTRLIKVGLPNMILTKDDIMICDMIKRNESDVGNIVLEIMAKIVFKFFVLYCFYFWQIDHNSVTRYPVNVVCIKMKHFKVMRKLLKKLGVEIC